VNPQAIIAALPWLRRLWRVLPPPLRVPVLLIAAAIGVVQFLQGRKQDQAGGRTYDVSATAGGPVTDPRNPSGSPT
jgi:hypothetical protein